MQGRKWLDKDAMASTKPFTFTSRDGKRIHGYLTIPHGSDGRNLPLIVNPHGGPIGTRDGWGSTSEAQLLRSEEHTSELQSLIRISYAVFCLKQTIHTRTHSTTND